MKLAVLALAAVLAAGGAGRAWAQSAEADAAGKETAAAPEALPEIFVEEAKSPFLKGLRRFEIVTFGAFPIMLFYTNIGFDLSRYIRSGYDSYYAPWPVKNEYSYKPSESEILVSIGTAALLSIGVGALDAILRSARARKARRAPPARVDSP